MSLLGNFFVEIINTPYKEVMKILYGQDKGVKYSFFSSLYNKKVSKKSNSVKDYKEFRLIVNTIFDVVSDGLVNSKGGVMVGDFGYLFVKKSPEEKFKSRLLIEPYNEHTPCFVPTVKYKFYTMNGWFSKDVQNAINYKVKEENFKYKNNTSNLKPLLK